MSYTLSKFEKRSIVEKLQRLKLDLSELFHYHMDGDRILLYIYLLYKASNIDHDVTYKEIISKKFEDDSHILNLIINSLEENQWNKLKELLSKYDSTVFASALLFNNMNNERFKSNTPPSLIKLAEKILKIEAKECVADIGCGTGDFIINASVRHNDALFDGYEINISDSTIARARAHVLSNNVNIFTYNVFELKKQGSKFYNPSIKYNKIFSNFPFGLKLRDLGCGVDYIEKNTLICPSLSKSTSSDWVFNLLITELLVDDGKAVSIVTNGSTWNTIDAPVRQYFLDNGLIEAVISLPAKIFDNTAIATSMIVFSKGNKGVRMIDATQLYEAGRRSNVLTEEHIDKIISLIKSDAEISKEISNDEIKKNNYVINPTRYIAETLNIKNAVKFETIIKCISRGASCSATQLDEMSSQEPTDIQYLMMANIKAGQIDEDLPYLSKIDAKYDKYCLKNKDLILSKNGFPYKIAIAEICGNRKILANGNLFIIQIDETKANPYFIKAFLESQKGIASLKSITVGSTIPNIGVEALKNMMIPLPSLEEQNKIADIYLSSVDELKMLQLRSKNLLEKINHIYDHISEDL